MNLRYAAPLVIAFATRALGQCTPVDCLSELPAWGGLCSATFAEGRIGVPYSDAISFHVTTACTPATLFDPTLTGVSIRITQLSSVGFSALPGGLTGTTNQASYNAPANGCASLDGVPSQAGVFEASVDLVVNVNAWPFSLACGGFGPIAQNGNEVSFPTLITILPDPSFNSPDAPLCLDGAPFDLSPTGTPGGVFSGPGVSGNTFDPLVAGIGTHTVKYVVSAQDGGAIAAATDSLSIDFVVEDCSGGCTAFSGTLSGGGQFCLDPTGTTLIATPNGDAVVPPGFEVLYILTSGLTIFIEDTMAQPMAVVTETGLYGIDCLVYDPATLDLGFLVFGGPLTVGDLMSEIDQQGACATIMSQPPVFIVGESYCCTAFAGTLGGVDFIPCLEPGGSVELLGIPGDDAVVPDGYEVIYMLTQGTELTIIGAGPDPVFEATATGLHTIHTLVYDPATLDLSIVELGVTTGVDVNALLIQGGGDICASLDVAGAPYVVEACGGPCDAAAGTTITNGEPCLDINGEALLLALANGDAVVPEGFVQTHVLTQGPGLVVIDGNADPEFTVTAIGEYRIHSLVIDPLTFQLAVEPGVTTGQDVLDYIASSGICADLDPVGALFLVDICNGIATMASTTFSMYPNPSAGGFFLVADSDGSALIEVLDLSGRVALQRRMACTKGAAAWVAADAAPGSYIVRISMGQERWEQRMVIQP
ncbi:MAG TPA: T9SS type A sorting domain-containing protein [Flavobacteriales bacterium]|nr:T9SS type A sorting domain-containing protein [Flavobacteriales bacterium]